MGKNVDTHTERKRKSQILTSFGSKSRILRKKIFFLWTTQFAAHTICRWWHAIVSYSNLMPWSNQIVAYNINGWRNHCGQIVRRIILIKPFCSLIFMHKMGRFIIHYHLTVESQFMCDPCIYLVSLLLKIDCFGQTVCWGNKNGLNETTAIATTTTTKWKKINGVW